MLKHEASISQDGRITATWRIIVVCALIAIVGFNLRSVILAVPPILPLIQHDLGLSYAATGLLTALPVLALAGVALPSGLLAERIGALLPSRTTFGLTSPVKHISENKPDTAMPTSHTP